MFTFKTLTTAATTLALAGALGAAGAATASAAEYVHSPSGNIRCTAVNFGGPGRTLTCSVVDTRRTIKISTSGRAYGISYRSIPLRGRSISYGTSASLGGGDFVCESETAGMTCSSAFATSIFLSREGTKIWN